MKLTDDSTMPFGKHKGQKLANLPASYLLWLDEQIWLGKDLKEYIKENKNVLKNESKEVVRTNHDTIINEGYEWEDSIGIGEF